MKFIFYPHRLFNSTFFLCLFALFLIFNHYYADPLWQWLQDKVSLSFFICVGGFAFYLSVFWLVATPYLLLNRYHRPRFLYRYKIQVPEGNWTSASKIPLSQAIWRVLFNQFFGTAPFLILTFMILHYFGYGTNLTTPTAYTVVWQFVLLLIIEDIFFFLAHYILHQKYFFRKIHRIHHEYKESIAITTHYVHYIEQLVGNLFPVFIGVVILQPHPFVIFFWILVVVINALHTHSGFAFPWMNYAVHHDWHHYYVSENFSALGWMDRVFNTDKRFRERISRT